MSMTLTQPDKWVRKAIYTALSTLNVDGDDIPVFDQRAPNTSPLKYVVMGQQNTEERRNKQHYFWYHDILLEIVTRSENMGNAGSRVAAENIYEAVRLALDGLTLDPASGIEIATQVYEYPGDMVLPLDSQIITRKFLRIQFHIN